MANNVFANGREVACKKGSGKSICAFPDVVWTPPDKVPPTPTGVPVPYPNTAMASDTSKGTKKVKISGKEAMLKNSSNFKKSMGDEAGVAQLKGFMTMKNRGKVYFQMWSMDVKFEGKNVVRHLDIATHNHGSQVGNTPPWPYLDSAALESPTHPCAKSGTVAAVTENCSDPIQGDSSDRCCEARKCVMVPEQPVSNCSDCGGKTPHHPIPVAELSHSRERGQSRGTPRYENYSGAAAPCICVDGSDHDARVPATTELMEHGKLGAKYAQLRNAELKKIEKTKIGDPFPFATALDCGAKAVSEVCGCDEACTRSQLQAAHKKMGVAPSDSAFKSKQKANVPLFKKPAGPPDADV